MYLRDPSWRLHLPWLESCSKYLHTLEPETEKAYKNILNMCKFLLRVKTNLFFGLHCLPHKSKDEESEKKMESERRTPYMSVQMQSIINDIFFIAYKSKRLGFC